MYSHFMMSAGARQRLLFAFVSSATLLITVTLACNGAYATDLIVKYDQSQIMRLPKPASEIIIGNPSIADVSVQSKEMLVITGKSFGITNIIVLDSERNIIKDQRIFVHRDQSKIINVHKGIKRQSFNCSSQCNPTITVGDDSSYIKDVASSSQLKRSFSQYSVMKDRGRGAR